MGADCVLLCRGRGEPFGLRLESVNFVVLVLREDVAVDTVEPLFVRGGQCRTQPPLTSRLFSARLLTLGSTWMSMMVLEGFLECDVRLGFDSEARMGKKAGI